MVMKVIELKVLEIKSNPLSLLNTRLKFKTRKLFRIEIFQIDLARLFSYSLFGYKNENKGSQPKLKPLYKYD